MKAIRLKTEFLSNPIGVGFQKPLFTWNCEGGVKQTAYRIIAECNGETLWDSGKVESGAMRAAYPKEVHSRGRVEWSITLWDENDTEGEAAKAFFEAGLLKKSDWKAKWIWDKDNISEKPTGF